MYGRGTPPVAPSVDTKGHARMSLAVKMAEEAHCCPQRRRLRRNVIGAVYGRGMPVAPNDVDVESYTRIFIDGVGDWKHTAAPVLLV